MRIAEDCAKCLFDRQRTRIKNENPAKGQDLYIDGVKKIIDERKETDCSPYLVYQFETLYTSLFGKGHSYQKLKKEYNDLVLAMEEELEKKIQGTEISLKESLKKALCYARIGNYIDFGAMDNVDTDLFLKLFDQAVFSEKDEETFESFYKECEQAEKFLLITDNCGEIVIDKLFVRVLKKCFPQLTVQVLVRGSDVLNDATMEDAIYAGMDQEAELLSSESAVAGTIYEMLPSKVQQVIDQADVMLLKGQGNFESFSGNGRHAYYAFLCKCRLFTTRFDVPLFTGMFVFE